MLMFVVEIYSFVFGHSPFMYLGDEEGLIASMLDLIGGKLPGSWDDKYRELHRKSGREWEVFESKLYPKSDCNYEYTLSTF